MSGLVHKSDRAFTFEFVAEFKGEGAFRKVHKHCELRPLHVKEKMMTNVKRALVALATATIQNNGNICQQFATIDATGLRNLRKKYGLTQAEFSEKFGIPISTLRKWEQGVQKPSTTSMSFLHKIAEAEPA